MSKKLENKSSNSPLQQSWRWYGGDDPVTLDDARQAGATGVVTALHHIPNGEVWTVDEITKRCDEVAEKGLVWEVVESLPVHDDIKLATGKNLQFIENYKKSLANLAQCGIKVVTYNFMPLLDWTRSDLDYALDDGSTCLRFDAIDAAVFDQFILQRKGARDGIENFKKVELRHSTMSDQDKQRLTNNIIAGLPGSEESFQLPEFREALSRYAGATHEDIRTNLFEFLRAVTPVAEEGGIRLAIHPDDPPIDIFGLPRVACTQLDFQKIFDEVQSPSNGMCFCTGSLGSREDNNVEDLVEIFAERIHFAHTRNVRKYDTHSFFESGHIEGDVNMATVLSKLITESERRGEPIPIRPDHGPRILTDRDMTARPGYYGVGRLKGLAELRGLEYGLIYSRESQ